MFSTLLIGSIFTFTPFHLSNILAEFFYLQSYTSGIWQHTWSLAVEEHFYLLFSVAMLILSGTNFIGRKKFIISSLIFLLVLSFLMRFQVAYLHREKPVFGFFQTHLRSDGILMGILLSYLYHFTRWTNIVLENKRIAAFFAALLILPGLFFNGGSFFMNSIGLSTANLGFAVLVLLSLEIEKYLENQFLKSLKLPVEVICFIGVNSYSIYLWHLNSKQFIYSYFSFDEKLMTLLYLSVSIVFGILMSYLIEKTFLKWRDRLFDAI